MANINDGSTEVELIVEAENKNEEASDVLGEAGVAALRAERAAAKAATKRATEAEAKVKAFEDAEKTEAQRMQDALSEAQKQISELTLAKIRAEVAAEKRIPVNLLSGSSREEIEAYADAILAFKQSESNDKMIVTGEGHAPTVALNGDGLESALRKAIGVN